MKTAVLTRTAAVGLLALTTAACTGPRSTSVDAQPETGAAEQGGPTRPAVDLARLEALYWDRLDMARSYYAPAEVEFMQGMISHHAQALVMARLAPANGASSQIQILSARIINAQNDEIASMQNWLRARGQEAPEVHEMGGNIMVHGGGAHDHANMPGMLTPEQLEQLRQARGTEFDRLFLTFMIQHHQGAVTMVDDLYEVDGTGQDEEAFKLASDIHVDQITEIERMTLMLEAIPDVGADP